MKTHRECWKCKSTLSGQVKWFKRELDTFGRGQEYHNEKVNVEMREIDI